MINYNQITEHCNKCSTISRDVIDEMLIYYAASRENLLPVFDTALKKYRHIAKQCKPAQINFLKSEFIAHRIFRKNGYIHKCLNDASIKRLPLDHYKFLHEQSLLPWRYSFAEIKSTVENNFFEMEDVITGEEYLLYSPAIKLTLQESNSRLWFNLIGFNGQCWQTFGIVIGMQAFTLDDIFFFATELNPGISDETALEAEIDKNPFPFFMLYNFSRLPVTISHDHELIHCVSIDDVNMFNTQEMNSEFQVEWNKGVYQLTHRKAGDYPHFAIAWYVEAKNQLTRTAMTEYGFELLTDSLQKAGLNLEKVSDVAVTPSMLRAAEQILNKKIPLYSFQKLFDVKPAENKDNNLEKLNKFIRLALPYFNEGKEPDIKSLAQIAGIDSDTAKDFWEHIKNSINENKKK